MPVDYRSAVGRSSLGRVEPRDYFLPQLYTSPAFTDQQALGETGFDAGVVFYDGMVEVWVGRPQRSGRDQISLARHAT